MAKNSSDNIRIKRKHLIWLRQAKGLSESSVDRAAASVDLYPRWLKGKDLRQFHSEKAIAFKRHLETDRADSGKPRSASTVNGVLRDLRAFTAWLADQPGYRSRISHADAAYFAPDRKSNRSVAESSIGHTRRRNRWHTLSNRCRLRAYLLAATARSWPSSF